MVIPSSSKMRLSLLKLGLSVFLIGIVLSQDNMVVAQGPARHDFVDLDGGVNSTSAFAIFDSSNNDNRARGFFFRSAVAGNSTNLDLFTSSAGNINNVQLLRFPNQLGIGGNPSNGMTLGDLGGFGPAKSLNVGRLGTVTAQIEVNNSAAPTVANRNLLDLRNNGGVRMTMRDTSAGGVSWLMGTDTSNRLVWRILGAGNPQLEIRQNGTLIFNRGNQQTFRVLNNGNGFFFGTVSAAGFNQLSDRNSKENFADIDPQQVLEKVTALPITKWSFKKDQLGSAHMGPMSQDFRKAFGLGDNEKSINTTDGLGVSLAAIQGLNEKLQTKLLEKDSAIDKLTKRLADQEAETDELKAKMERLESMILELSSTK